MRNRVRNYILITVIVAGSITLAELAARNYLITHPPPFMVVIGKVPAYEHASYYSDRFVREKVAAFSSFVLQTDGSWVSNFHGTWFNFDNGFRRTTGQPESALNIIYMFGNSSLISLDVPDEDTIASYLQGLLKNYRVVNLGASGATAQVMSRRLRTIDLRHGDIVIFYDGVTDAQDFEFNRIENRRNSSVLGIPCNFFATNMSRLALGKLYCLWSDAHLFWTNGDTAGRAQIVAAEYEHAIADAELYTRQHRIQFYHFLQPHMLSRDPMPFEQSIVDNNREDGEILLRNWPGLQQVRGTDLTHVLDDLRVHGAAVYFDYVHVNEIANAVIARAIFDRLTLI